MSARRFVALRLDDAGRWTQLPSGALVYRNARIARAGIQGYGRRDGTTRRELRPEEEVFSPEALASLSLRPLLIDHVADEGPPPPDRVVGSTGTARRDGDWVVADLMFTDVRAVDEIRSGRRAELSAGYVAELEETPGTWNGEHYDAVQRRPRALHVALVDRGRAGPETRLRLDSDAFLIDAKGDEMKTTKRDEIRNIDAAVEEAQRKMSERNRSLNKANGAPPPEKLDEAGVEEARRRMTERNARANVKKGGVR